MNDIQTAVLTALPPKRKNTPSGWISFDAPCCIHRNESRDERQRGGLLTSANGGFQYHCFNCNFKAGWTPGHGITKNTKNLFAWLGMSQDDILKLGLYALKVKNDNSSSIKKLSFELEERLLPEDCKSIDQWLEEGCDDSDLLKVIEYLINTRKVKWEWYPWYWSSANGYKDRVIIPFFHDKKIVGWTGRKIREGKPKYLTDAQPGYVFNLDAQQDYSKKFIIVTEGQFDAIAIEGAAVMHNEINDTQANRINMLGKEVIVVPDRDKPGAKLVAKAVDYGWNVSVPPWDSNVKDVADAVKKYGRLYTLYTILHYKETSKIKIQLLQKKLENINE